MSAIRLGGVERPQGRAESYRLTARCLPCGQLIMAKVTVPAAEEVREPIGADEMLDLREAMDGGEWWGELTGSVDCR